MPNGHDAEWKRHNLGYTGISCTAIVVNKLNMTSGSCLGAGREGHDLTKQGRIVEVQESNTGGGFAIQCSSGNLPAQVGAQVMHEKLGVTGYHQPAVPMQASDLACNKFAYHCLLKQSGTSSCVCTTAFCTETVAWLEQMEATGVVRRHHGGSTC